MANIIRTIIVVVCLAIISACGGGGGSAGNISGGTALFTSAPSTVTVGVGISSSVYSMGGGSQVYSVSSSNNLVATVGQMGKEFVITGRSSGKAVVIAKDTLGAEVTIDVVVGTGDIDPLFTTAASDIIVAPNATTTYKVSGGRAPYSVSSSNANVVKASINSNILSITGVIAGSANILVKDDLGTTISINAVVGTGTQVALFTTAPESVILVLGDAQSYTISGGSAPYSVASSNPGVASTTVIGSVFNIIGARVGTAQISVRDSLGALIQVNTTVTAISSTPIDIFPGDAIGSVGDTLIFKVSGGSPQFIITNNNPSIATVSPTSVGIGGTFSATLLNVGSTDVTVVDAQGQFKKIKVTANATSSLLRISPSEINIGEDTTGIISLTVYGGTAPYRAFTSDLGLSSVSITGKTLDVDLGSQGSRCVRPVDEAGTHKIGGTYTVTLTVVDSLGASATSSMIIKDNSKGGAGCL